MLVMARITFRVSSQAEGCKWELVYHRAYSKSVSVARANHNEVTIATDHALTWQGYCAKRTTVSGMTLPQQQQAIRRACLPDFE